ncbi:MAG: AIR synthase-related protein [Gaiellaceae bacterium]
MAAKPLATGKIPAGLLAELLGALPPAPPELRLGPAVGEDACAIEVPAGVLVVASDPITLTSGEPGRFSVVVNTNDVAVTGARPRWFLAVVLAPPGTDAAELRRLFADLGAALAEVGAHLVGGHTEVTDAVTRPVVVGQMLGLTEDGRVVATGGARAGDVVLQVGAAPVEGAAVLAREGSARLTALDAGVLAAAWAALDRPGISVVEPALAAARLGATALHDPTEGGLAAGLHELAPASGVRICGDRAAVLWFEPGLRVCEALGADPWSTLASGSLLATFPAAAVGDALAALAAAGFAAAEVGVVEPGSGVVDTDGTPLAWPKRDEVVRGLAAQGP